MKMDSLKYIIWITLLLVGLSSCEDVIQIETDPAESLIVVDGWISTEQTDQTITLSQSQPYFDASIPSPLTGATVSVESSNGSVFSFTENNPGTYTWLAGADSLGTVGTSFELNVIVNGTVLIASATANRVPPIDSIGQKLEEESIQGLEGVRTNFFARDPIGLGDTYWIKTFKNGDYLNQPEEINIAFDAGFDAGAQVDGLIFIPPIRDATNPLENDDAPDAPPWITGDEIKVEIHSISNQAFLFLETARDQITNGDNGLFSIPLVNARGNIIDQSTGDRVLGVFNVAVVSRIVDTIE